MSVFTIQLNELMESGFDIGLNDYPIFDEAYRPLLNRKITDHYALREIGHETESMFKFALNRRMREIMPYYNQLYLSEKIVFDPLSTMNYTEAGISSSATTGTSHAETSAASGATTDTTSDTTNSTNNTSSSRSRAVNSEMPQVMLSPDEDYATSAADSVSDSTTTGDGTATVVGNETSTGTDDATTDTTGSESVNGTLDRTMQGYQGHAAELLMRYRESLLNIDMLVIGDLANLFMQLWNNGDEYSTRGRNYSGYLYPTF